jgi:hypothetical protein
VSLLKSDAGPVAENLPADTILREAENFDRGNVLADTTNYGPGIGIILNRGELPNFVEYDLQIPKAGAYQLELRYAAQDPRPIDVLIDGKVRKTNAAESSTGSWFPESQRWSPEGVFDLPAGKVVLRLQRTSGPIPHFDRLALVPRAADAANPQRLTWTADRLAEERRLIPFYITAWTGYLDTAQKDPQSVWQPWFAYRRGEMVAPEKFTGLAAEMAMRLLPAGSSAESPIRDAADLAGRYRNEIKAADKRAREAADPSAVAAVDNSLRKTVDGKESLFRKTPQLEEQFSKEDLDAISLDKTQLADLEKAAPAVLPQAMAVEDGKGADLKIHIRGSHLTLGETSPRGFPKAIAVNSLATNPPTFSERSSGRLELANWIADPQNPLTSRVMVNRLWRWPFGAGLVRSTDNFGNLGDRASHPELLDWLATRFVESGWSVKAMHRLIMLSSTYQMSTAYNAAAAEVDPDNRLLWRMNRRRLEAEAVRDSLLFVGGNLDTSLGGTLLKNKPREYVTSTASVNGTSYAVNRRSIYLPVVRSALYEAFQAFDFAEPTTLKGDRESTTIAAQALFMMNSDVMDEQSARLASRLMSAHPENAAARVQDLYASALGRLPTGAESARALAFVDRYTADLQNAQGSAAQTPDATVQNAKLSWQALCRVLLSSNEFLYVE